MQLDLSKLAPAPWVAEGHLLKAGRTSHGPMLMPSDMAAFCALARNDIDVKLRRGWHTERCSRADQWVVPQLIEVLLMLDGKEFDECSAAVYQKDHDVGILTKADRWYKANVEAKECPHCEGTGQATDPVHGVWQCQECNGSGRIADGTGEKIA